MVLLHILYLFIFLISSHAAIFTPEFQRELVSYIEDSMKCHHVPGMTLSVVKGNEVWFHGFGKEDMLSGKDVDHNSAFLIASVTKSFTATLLGILLSENGLDWTAKVTRILGPQYEFVDPYRTKELTLRDLLSHRTGLARLDVGGLGSGLPKSMKRSAFCKRMKFLPEERPIRDGFIYNNFMFMMLGHVAEVLGNDTWENLITTKLFQPLGMTNSTILKTPTELLKPDVARPYIYKDDEFQNGTLEIYDLHPIEPAAAIMSTAADMAKWIKFNLNSGKTETGVQLLDKKRMDEIHTITTAMMPSVSLTKPDFPISDIVGGYGYGWIVSEYRGYRKVWHDGGLGSYISLLWTFPDMDVGLFASVSGPGFGIEPDNHNIVSFSYIIDHLFGLEPWLNKTTSCTFSALSGNATETKPRIQESPLPVHNLADFEGTYGNHLFPDINVYSNSTDLLLYSNRIHGILRPSSQKDLFVYVITEPWEYSSDNIGLFVNVTFQRDIATTTVTSLTLLIEVELKYEKGISFTQEPSKQPVVIG